MPGDLTDEIRETQTDARLTGLLELADGLDELIVQVAACRGLPISLAKT